MATGVGMKKVYVASGTGTRGIKQVNVTGTTGAGVFQTWQQITAAQFAQGPTGQFETVQRVNAGTVLTQSTKTVCIPSFVDPNAGGGGSYTAKAVHFDGATFLSNNALVSTDNAFISYSFWVKSADITIDTTVFVVDPNGNYGTFSGFSPSGSFANRASNTDDSESSDYTGADGTLADTNWHHWLVCIRGDNTAPPSLGAAYLDDVLVPNVTGSTHNPLPAIATNGLLMMIGDDPFDNHFFGDFADLRIMPGTNLLDGTNLAISTATRRLFIDGSGKPVNPATATTALGTPCVLFSGDASTFATNQGSGGSFTVTGTLTTAATHP